jgi:FkbM family methyltransferase
MPRTGDRVHRAVTACLPDHADVELLPGIDVELDLRQAVERQSWWQGDRYEHPTTKLFDAWARRATHVFDVGANYGFFSLRAVHAGCPEVHAFEPHPDLHRRLLATAARNHLGALHPHHLGLSDEPARLTLHIRDDEEGHGSFAPRSWPGGRTSVVEVTSFDRWRAARGLAVPAAPTWAIKIDVEGYELHVLRGMAEALSARAFLGVVVELNELTLRSAGATGSEVLDLLFAAGYREVEEQPAVDGMRNAFLVPNEVSP